jgi:hypothetical protein
MSMKRLAYACLIGAVLCVTLSRSAAHPPDLPVDTKDVCVPCPDGGCCELNTRQAWEACEAVSPMLCEIINRFCESFTVGFGAVPPIELKFEFRCSPTSPVAGGQAAPAGAVDEARRGHARRMYLIGERCRRTGDLDMAENCYQETKLLCPGCDYARKAERRLQQVRALRTSEREDVGEEAEPAKEETPKGEGNYNFEVPPPACLIPPSDKTYEPQVGTTMGSRTFSLESRGVLHAWMRREAQLGKMLLFETDLAKLAEAKVMFYVGERCRRGGDPEMAYRCYENAYRTCPQSRHGKKAQMRMRKIKEEQANGQKQGGMTSDMDILFVSGDFLWVGGPSAQMRRSPQQRRRDWDGFIGHFIGRDEQPPSSPVNIEIVEEESRPMLEGDAEESEESGSSIAQSEPPILYIAPPVRNLKLGEEQEEAASVANAACEDLSDWLPQAIRLLRGAGSLRIDATRLGRLMSRGEGAVRALGCAVVYECGRTLVVYPGRPQ